MKALKWCRKYVDLSDEEIEVVMAARKAMLYVNGEPWAKKGGEVFDEQEVGGAGELRKTS